MLNLANSREYTALYVKELEVTMIYVYCISYNSNLNSFEIAHLSVVFVCQPTAFYASKYVL